MQAISVEVYPTGLPDNEIEAADVQPELVTVYVALEDDAFVIYRDYDARERAPFMVIEVRDLFKEAFLGSSLFREANDREMIEKFGV